MTASITPHFRFKPLALALAALLTACAQPAPWPEATPLNPTQTRDNNTEGKGTVIGGTDDKPAQTAIYKIPAAPVSKQPPVATQTPPKFEDEKGKEATVAFDAMPLPQFIQSVYGVILKRTINIDPQILSRRDLVSMRSGKPMTPSQLYTAANTVLQSYGIAVQDLPGVTRFVPEAGDAGTLPEIRRGRAMPEVPQSVRPQFYLVELQNTQTAQAMTWLTSIFGTRITVRDDATRNALMISGSPQNISAAMQALNSLDQPLMRGRVGARINPVYWSADEMAKRLNEILMAEGYYSSNSPSANTPALLVPVSGLNSVLVFVNNQPLLDHILHWAEELDQPSQARNGNYFIYPVRNADASEIANTLSQVLGGGGASTGGDGKTTAPANAGGRAVVDKATNSLIIKATPAEYQQWYTLIRELDKPARSALINVTVAEVKTSATNELGFEWMVRNIDLGKLGIGTLTLGKGGLLLDSTKGIQPRAGSSNATVVLNALASQNLARTLSNPSLLTRSGEQASITIGEEVPIITSTQSNANSGATDKVLSTVQYRQTGTTLNVKPVVHNGGRIELTITQEVSTANQTTVSGIDSPTIGTKKIDTKLTVRDGNTVILGGIISDTSSNANGGVPYAMDVPVVGSLFKNEKNSGNRTELVMLITAYAVEDDFDLESIADAFRQRLPWSEPLWRKTPQPEINSSTITNANSASSSAAQPASITGRAISQPYGKPSPQTAPNAAATSPVSAAETVVETRPVSGDEVPVASSTPAPATQPTTTGSAPAAPATGNTPVTDEQLKKELMDALKKGGYVK
ncbi:secretin N-terminal domain-containing protein [Chitinilyticum aquatile]|uniref:secretin N-terminal domain-containing protein n=1 Tax=Chitinilyticum aquatile TaxID=362520 RepID=UPI0004020347|nr:secretin N-terminal domain-containing protein [Chitinilyticum aquatile]